MHLIIMLPLRNIKHLAYTASLIQKKIQMSELLEPPKLIFWILLFHSSFKVWTWSISTFGTATQSSDSSTREPRSALRSTLEDSWYPLPRPILWSLSWTALTNATTTEDVKTVCAHVLLRFSVLKETFYDCYFASRYVCGTERSKWSNSTNNLSTYDSRCFWTFCCLQHHFQ